MLNAPATFLTTLCANVTSSTTHQVQFPPWFRGVNNTAYPGCAAFQLFSIRLYSMRTRRAFFSSKMFFTSHCVPVAGGLPDLPGAEPVCRNAGSVTLHDSHAPAGFLAYTVYPVAPSMRAHDKLI